MVCSSAPLLCPLLFYNPSILLSHCIIMTCSVLSFSLSSSWSTHTRAQIWEWQFNEKCFSIIKTKGENASINTHFQTTRTFLDGWDFLRVCLKHTNTQQRLMYRHINQASQVTTAIIPLIHVMWMNESLFLSLSLFQTQLTVGINASYSFVFLSLRTQNTDVYTLTMYMWTVSEKTALETHSGKLLHYGVSDSHSTKKETKIKLPFMPFLLSFCVLKFQLELSH